MEKYTAIQLRTLFWGDKAAGIIKELTDSSRVTNSSYATSVTATRAMITAVRTTALSTTLTRAANITARCGLVAVVSRHTRLVEGEVIG